MKKAPNRVEAPCAPIAPRIREEVSFTMPPVDLMEDRMLHPVDRVIAAILAAVAGSGYCCWPTNRTLAGRIGCSTKTVQRALARLASTGWIAVEPAPTTSRGQLIRLQWRRKGAGHPCPGGRTPVSGGGRTSKSPLIRSIQGERKLDAPASGPKPGLTAAEEVLSAEDLEFWRGVSRGGDRTLEKCARSVLKKHEQALALVGKPPASGSLAKDTPDAG